MQALATIETKTELRLTNDDKLRIGIAWDALSPNSRRAYKRAWRQLDEFLSTKGEALDNITDTQFAVYLSTLDAQGIAPSTLSVNLVVDSLSIYYIFALMFHYLYRRPLAFSEFFLDFIS